MAECLLSYAGGQPQMIARMALSGFLAHRLRDGFRGPTRKFIGVPSADRDVAPGRLVEQESITKVSNNSSNAPRQKSPCTRGRFLGCFEYDVQNQAVIERRFGPRA
jgi:hypothetical protein